VAIIPPKIPAFIRFCVIQRRPAPRNRKFESISLQRRVSNERVAEVGHESSQTRPGIGERKYEPADVSLFEERQYVGEREIAIMRSFVISPADVESHPSRSTLTMALLIAAMTRSTNPRNSPTGRSL
jgi:hypothetical protein